jgi:C-terminal processing protease CtpA/Prc
MNRGTKTRAWRNGLWAILAGLCAWVLGCSGNGNDAQLRKTVEDLKAENAALKKLVEQHEKELRPLQKRVDDHDVQIQDQDRTLGKVRKDLESRLTEMVAEQFSGRVRRFARAGPPVVGPEAPPAAPPPQKFEERAWMGFDGQDLNAELAEQLKVKAKTGVLITDLREGAPAAQAGLKKNDLVQSLDDVEVKTRADLDRAMQGKKPHQNVTVGVLRDAETVKVAVQLGVRRVPVAVPE